MKRKHKRLLFIIVTFVIFGSSVVVVLNKLRNNISFFFTPTEVLSSSVNVNKNDIRIGGMVISGSLKRHDNLISFFITDLENQIKVVYQGILPPLFSEGSWVVAKGRMVNGEFNAHEILAKHDENYKPDKYRVK
ncbi:cytochrome c maturation protein CcmE [Ehrlichia minasensis]|uniref:Cytochrome c-type biogenesis protein CcmE n=1 Tax=Ehrlichia minasensis TaxID=1242993 RepID=A0A4Q6IAP3_9RICK|nr:cytochrome c maturation protein CcmE [Ehrlichia minasensis]RZB12368.1 cytochrome c maturation protein CcmE [Ehrlichia minasensis]CEI84687.1 Cytochrome c-type biogenesis protein CcmE (Cytoch rome c maturation protein E) (Heme chaperone CcmE) [Ehrlichia minasensis]